MSEITDLQSRCDSSYDRLGRTSTAYPATKTLTTGQKCAILDHGPTPAAREMMISVQLARCHILRVVNLLLQMLLKLSHPLSLRKERRRSMCWTQRSAAFFIAGSVALTISAIRVGFTDGFLRAIRLAAELFWRRLTKS